MACRVPLHRVRLSRRRLRVLRATRVTFRSVTMFLHRCALVAALAAVTLVNSGCLPVVAGGLAVGTLAAMDRRSVGTQTDDTELELRVGGRMSDAIRGSRGVSVTSYNKNILLTGQVPDAAAKADAERAARLVNGVRQIHNELEVGPRVALTTLTLDTTLTGRVKTAFLEQKVLDSNAVKVVTENGTVYLMGLVTRREGPAYATVASRVTGIKKVVTLFEYITDEELARIKAR